MVREEGDKVDGKWMVEMCCSERIFHSILQIWYTMEERQNESILACVIL
jgi:hypothetical protein